MVIGGGYIGIEIGTLYAKLGSKVTVVEALPGILAGNDPEIVQLVARKLKKLGVEMLTGAKAKSWAEKDGRAVVTVEVEGKEAMVEADKVLVAVGRRPNSEGLGLEEIGVKIERGFVPVDRQLRTNVPGIYAIGDVAGQPMLAHKASHEAEVVAEVIAGHKAEMDVRCIPAVIFSDPEVATAGISAAEAAKRGRTVKVGKFPFAALGRAIANADTDGFVKVVIDADSQRGAGHPRRRQRRLGRHRRGRAGHRDGCAGRRSQPDHPRPPDAARGDHGGGQGEPGRSDPYSEPVTTIGIDLSTPRFGAGHRSRDARVWGGLGAAARAGDARARRTRSPTRCCCVEHPHVITAGRRTHKENLLATEGIPIFEIERGGDVTYHGPGQLVGYPIFLLRDEERDLHVYLRNLEEALIRALARFDLPGERKPAGRGSGPPVARASWPPSGWRSSAG